MNIEQAVNKFLEILAFSRSPNTARAYGAGYKHFLAMLDERGIFEIVDLDERSLGWFSERLTGYADSTIDTWTAGIISFFGYLISERLSDTISLDRAKLIRKQRIRHRGTRFSRYPMDDLRAVLVYMRNMKPRRWGSRRGIRVRLLDLRDIAIHEVLSSTGLRNSELRALCVGDLDSNKTTITGKGNKQAVIRFSPEALESCQKYLEARGETGPDLPLFIAHDKKWGLYGEGKGNQGKPLTDTGLNSIIKARAAEALGCDDHEISCHAWRHFFITVVWEKTGDLLMAQKLGRHTNTQTTLRYCHVSERQIDDVYADIFGG